MENLNSVLQEAFGFQMGNDFIQRAVYSEPMDCVTYMSADVIAISDRIDEFLTIIVDAKDVDKVVGFKVKGFRHFFSTVLKEKYDLSEADFIPLVRVLEEMLTSLGDGLSKDANQQKRARAYSQAKELAERDNVVSSLPLAA